MPVLRFARMNSLRIARGAFDAILNEAARSADGLETGGILLGYERSEAGPPLVMHAGSPGPGADRRQDFFLRDLAHSRALAEDAWVATRSRWIGDWHTHPTTSAFPSDADLGSYVSLLSDPDLGFSSFVSLIVVPLEPTWGALDVAPWEIELGPILPDSRSVMVSKLELGESAAESSFLPQLASQATVRSIKSFRRQPNRRLG